MSTINPYTTYIHTALIIDKHNQCSVSKSGHSKTFLPKPNLQKSKILASN